MRPEPAAFDLWVRRDLSTQFGAVLREPLPQHLVDLLESADRR